MRGSRVLTIEDFSKGLSLTANKFNTPYDMAYDAVDVEPLGQFGLRKREATANFATGFTDSLDYLLYGRADGLIYAGMPSTTAGKIYKVTIGGSPTAIGATLTNFAAPIFAIEAPTVGGQGPIFWAAQTGTGDTDASAYYYSSSSARGTWTGPPAGRVRAMCYHGNRVWIAIGTSLYFSDLGDPTSFPAPNVVQLEPWASGTLAGTGSITALVPCGPVLLAFKSNKSWVIYDLDTGANRTLADVGCSTARACVQDTEGSVYFANDRGVFHTDSSTVREAVNTIGYGLQDSSLIVLGAVGSRYIIATSVSATYVYDTVFKSWWLHRLDYVSTPSVQGGGMKAVIAHPTNVEDDVVYISQNNADTMRLWRPNHSGLDNAAATIDGNGSHPDFVWTGGLIELEKEITTKKRLREVNVVGGGAEPLTVMGQAITFDAGWAGTTTRKRIPSLGVSREWNLTISGTGSTDANARIESVTFAFIPRKN